MQYADVRSQGYRTTNDMEKKEENSHENSLLNLDLPSSPFLLSSTQFCLTDLPFVLHRQQFLTTLNEPTKNSRFVCVCFFLREDFSR